MTSCSVFLSAKELNETEVWCITTCVDLEQYKLAYDRPTTDEERNLTIAEMTMRVKMMFEAENPKQPLRPGDLISIQADTKNYYLWKDGTFQPIRVVDA